jgi:hypothetical protein
MPERAPKPSSSPEGRGAAARPGRRHAGASGEQRLGEPVDGRGGAQGVQQPGLHRPVEEAEQAQRRQLAAASPAASQVS